MKFNKTLIVTLFLASAVATASEIQKCSNPVISGKVKSFSSYSIYNIKRSMSNNGSRDVSYSIQINGVEIEDHTGISSNVNDVVLRDIGTKEYTEKVAEYLLRGIRGEQFAPRVEVAVGPLFFCDQVLEKHAITGKREDRGSYVRNASISISIKDMRDPLNFSYDKVVVSQGQWGFAGPLGNILY